MLTCDFGKITISAQDVENTLKELSKALKKQEKILYEGIDYDCESDADWEDSEDENDVWD